MSEWGGKKGNKEGERGNLRVSVIKSSLSSMEEFPGKKW